MTRLSTMIVVAALATACGGTSAPAPKQPATPEDTGGGGIGLGNAPGVPARSADVSGKNGRIPPEEIQKVVRADFAAMKRCYEAGLGRNPNLTGRISTKFVIDLEGHVASAEPFESGPAFPDADVVACVVARFATLTFPKPEGGIVTVVYPIVFNPGD